MRIIDWSSDVCSSDLVGLAIAASAFGVIYSLRFVRGVFFGPVSTRLPRQPHEPPRWMRTPIGLLALACLLVGILPAQVIGPPLQAAASAVLGAQAPTYSLAVWHGWTAPLQMSVIAFISGCLLYVALRSEEHTSELQSLMRSSYAVFCVKNKTVQT